MTIPTPRRRFIQMGALVTGGWLMGVGSASQSRGEGEAAGRVPTLLTTSRIVRIPRDYATLQDALRGESRWLVQAGGHPGLDDQELEEVTVTFHIESGHRLARGACFWNGCFGHIRITSDDEVVSVADDFTGPLISVRHAIGPVLATMIDLRDWGTDGYLCENATGCIERHHVVGKVCGVRHAGLEGVRCIHGSTMRIGERDHPHRAGHAEVSGCGRWNIHCAVASAVSARYAILSRCKGTVDTHPTSGVNVYCTHSSAVTCDSADCSGAAHTGVWANGASHVDAANVNATGCGRYGFRAERCSTMRLVAADASGSGIRDLYIRYGGMMEVSDVRTTRGRPALEDTNVPSFNRVFGQGILFHENADDAIPAEGLRYGGDEVTECLPAPESRRMFERRVADIIRGLTPAAEMVHVPTVKPGWFKA